MEEQWVVDRCKLREVWLEHPEWNRRLLAEAVGYSKSWVKKWLHRIRSTTPEEEFDAGGDESTQFIGACLSSHAKRETGVYGCGFSRE